MLLSHSSGLLNWRWINADGRPDFKYSSGERYVYAGEGMQIAQLLVEERSGQPLAELMQRQARRARAAGSMVTTVTTVADHAALLAGVLRREGLSPASQQPMLAPQSASVSPQPFPSPFPGRTDVNDGIGAGGGAGLGRLPFAPWTMTP